MYILRLSTWLPVFLPLGVCKCQTLNHVRIAKMRQTKCGQIEEQTSLFSDFPWVSSVSGRLLGNSKDMQSQLMIDV